MSDCYYDDEQCRVCPEQPYIAPVPARIEKHPVIGWNAGANSIESMDGDFHVVLDAPQADAGLALGLKDGRMRPAEPALIEHGFLFLKAGSQSAYCLLESGRRVTQSAMYQDGDTFEIRRIGTEVTYYVTGHEPVASQVSSLGRKVVNACLYASGDTAPSGSEPVSGS